MQTNRAPSPFTPPSPYTSAPDIHYPVHQSLPKGPATVGPGSITYTTSTGPDGRITYEPYRAVAASYQTPSGIISGIQWVKADPTSNLQSGSQPFVGGGYGNWNTPQIPSGHDWQRTEQKRRKHGEKTESERMREMDPASQKDSAYELRMARERDAQSAGNRERRKSFNGPSQIMPAVAFPLTGGGTGYPVHPTQVGGFSSNHYSNVHGAALGPTYPSEITASHSRNTSVGGGTFDIASEFSNLEIDRQKDYDRDRKISSSKRSRKYSSGADYERSHMGSYVDRHTYQPIHGVYPSAPELYNKQQNMSSNYYQGSSYIAASPNKRPGEVTYGSTGVSGYPTSNNPISPFGSSPVMNAANIGRSTTPFGNPGIHVYPRGHILEGQPIVNSGSNSRSRGPSRASSPNPAKYGHVDASQISKSPRIPVGPMPGEPQQLPAPEAFSRPINGSNSFMAFEITKVGDMEDLLDTLPKMPGVLASHDIYPEDWNRCMQDLGRSWTGQLPLPSFGTEGQPRRSRLAVDLVNLWNDSFFSHRGVELMLYKGREKKTGPRGVHTDNRLPAYNDDDEDDSSSPGSNSDFEQDINRPSGPYGRPNSNHMAELQDTRHRRYEEKREKRRHRRARNANVRDRTYSVFVACLSSRGPPSSSGYTTNAQAMPGSYGGPAAGYQPPGTFIPPGVYPTQTPGYGPPIGIPKTRSHGYGASY